MKHVPLVGIAIGLLALSPLSGLSAQLTEEVLQARIQLAETDESAATLLQAAHAARFLRDFEKAEAFLEKAEEVSGRRGPGILFERLSFEFGSGGGAEGARAALRKAYDDGEIPPLELATWVNNFPAIMVGGEYDNVVERFSADAEDPNYRCACLTQKAWMHRAAGRWDEAVVIWAENAKAMDETISGIDNPDTFAQFARNYARAGQMERGRDLLEQAMAMPVSDEAQARTRRRWAQAYVELGEVEKVVEHLEYLLSIPSLITVHSLESRLSWAPVRDEPAFQALLDKHR